jgi:hypothetical protein
MTPYWRERALEQCGSDFNLMSFEVSELEQIAFGLESRDNYCTLDDRGSVLRFEFSRHEFEVATCERCDERGPSENFGLVYGERLRRGYNEMTWCDGCRDDHAHAYDGDYYDVDHCVFVEGEDITVPQHIAHENYYYHESDGCWRSYPEESEDEDEDESRDADDTGHIFRYGTNVLQTYAWPQEVKSDALCFGVELEVEPAQNTGNAQRALAASLGGKYGMGEGAYILAADSSLDKGVEIITVPQTLEQHRTGSRIQWHAISKALQAAKAKSGAGTDNCGMHVHINRKALSALTVGKMLVFINGESTRTLVELIAQRPASRYCERKEKKITDALRPEDSHYDALNIGTDHGTLELRVFRGNTRYSRILKNIEFAHALCLYCRDASLQDVSDPALFRAWLLTRASTYPNLSKFLSEHTEDC